jgi:hypothetical protein
MIEQNQKYPCFYPGTFNPPTKLHLNAVHWLLSKPEVGHVNVVIGADDPKNPSPLSQDQKALLWEILLKSKFAPQVSIIKAKNGGPVKEIYSLFEKKNKMPAYIALHEKASRNKKFQEMFDVFPHYGIQIVPSQFNKSSERVLSGLASDDMKVIKNELPPDFSEDMTKAYIDILKQKNDPEAPDEQSPTIRDKYASYFDDGFWKNSLSL